LLKYVLKRLLSAVFTLAIILTIVFFLLRQMPIEGYFDNFDKMSEAAIQSKLRQMGLNDPFFVQLKRFFTDLLHGDLGASAKYRVGESVAVIIRQKAPISIEFGLVSMLIALVLGVPLGAAMARSKVWDRFGTVFIVLINAVPSAIYYIFIQMYGTQLLGTKMLFDKTLPVTWILPLFSMALGNIAYYAMWLRRYMVDEMTHDYVKLARAKGVPTRRIMMKHVFRNAVVPMIQYLPTSLLYTVCGVSVNLLVTLPTGYALSRKDFALKKFVTFFYMLTMFIGGGMMPTYLIVKQTGLLNSMWALIIPGAMGVYNMIVAKTFFSTNIPLELMEAAKLDGCGNTRFFFHIVLPLSGAITAILVLYYGQGHWNSYFSALLYINDREKWPLQLELRNILLLNTNTMTKEFITEEMRKEQARREALANMMKYSLIIISSIPMLIVYPFVQKHFVKGVMIGSVKG